jgi:hypothetical protein
MELVQDGDARHRRHAQPFCALALQRRAADGRPRIRPLAELSHRGRAAARSALAFELAADAAHGACVELGLQVEVAAAEGPSAVDFVLTTAQCAESLPDADPRKRRVRERAVAALARIGRDPAAALSPDDRVDALWSLVGLHDLLQQPEAARNKRRTYSIETRAMSQERRRVKDGKADPSTRVCASAGR